MARQSHDRNGPSLRLRIRSLCERSPLLASSTATWRCWSLVVTQRRPSSLTQEKCSRSTSKLPCVLVAVQWALVPNLVIAATGLHALSANSSTVLMLMISFCTFLIWRRVFGLRKPSPTSESLERDRIMLFLMTITDCWCKVYVYVYIMFAPNPSVQVVCVDKIYCKSKK